LPHHVQVRFTDPHDELGVAAHRGFAAGRYRDWSWSDVWTDVSRCASGTITAVAAGCTCGWRGPAHQPRRDSLDDCRWDWVFVHVVQLPSGAEGSRDEPMTSSRRADLTLIVRDDRE
jgi:hypothetical protein